MASFITFYSRVTTGSLTCLFYDTTLWGVAGVPLKSQVTAAVMTISLPDPTTLMPDDTNQVTVDLFALGYPNTNPITLTSVDFGQAAVTDRIPDGVYAIELAVTTDTGSGEDVTTGEWNMYVYQQAQCCADGLANSLPCKCTDCLTPKQMRLLKMRMDLYAVSLGEIYCQDNYAASLFILDAQQLCAGSPCSSCGC